MVTQTSKVLRMPRDTRQSVTQWLYLSCVGLEKELTNLKIAKHQTRKKSGGSQKRERLSFIEWCLTKGVHSSHGLPDTSHLVYPYPSSQCLGGLGHSPVVLRAEPNKKGFVDSFMLKRLKKCLFSHFLNPQNHLQNPDRVFQSSTIRIKPQILKECKWVLQNAGDWKKN